MACIDRARESSKIQDCKGEMGKRRVLLGFIENKNKGIKLNDYDYKVFIHKQYG